VEQDRQADLGTGMGFIQLVKGQASNIG